MHHHDPASPLFALAPAQSKPAKYPPRVIFASFPLHNGFVRGQPILTLALSLPLSVGGRYRWRKSYADMTDEEIYGHLSDALAFAQSDDEPVTTCVATGAACCLSWAATKLEVDLLFADVDETEGSIKVPQRLDSLTAVPPCGLLVSLVNLFRFFFEISHTSGARERFFVRYTVVCSLDWIGLRSRAEGNTGRWPL